MELHGLRFLFWLILLCVCCMCSRSGESRELEQAWGHRPVILAHGVAEAEGSQFQGQNGQFTESLSQNKNLNVGEGRVWS